ncbi:MAG: prolyl oligopeptidase family serine peptidase [Galactobacter sp.]|uniref:S9 family peptidase n=1 Tax=Galactobacter sp. TaxID=2676125 RepID=UPI0025C1CF62|nr:prolyl oligopeptidase family serine peptidase [Galactobacter sp.]
MAPHSDSASAPATAQTPITELLDAPRLAGLHSTPDGRVVLGVSRPDAKGNAYRTELVELTDGSLLPLTRGNASVGSVALAEDGTTYFTAKRVGEDGESSDDAQLWALPPRGEARELASRPGGFGTLELITAEDGTRRLIAELEVHSQAANEDEHKDLSKQRKDAKVTAALHSEFPTRYWNTDLGPSRTVLAVAELNNDGGLGEFAYLPMPAGRLSGWSVDRTGAHALVTMNDSRDDLIGFPFLYLLDLAGSTEPQLLLETTAKTEYWGGDFNPAGTHALVDRSSVWTQTQSLASRTQVLNLATGEATDLWPEHDFWIDPTWLDDTTVVATSDDQGRGSVWIGTTTDAAPRRLAGGPGQNLTFSGAQVSGGRIVATASGIDVAPHPVAIDPTTGQVTELPNPAAQPEQTGTLTEVTATAEDGTALRAWLRVPSGDGPHPLVVFAHGGPWGSWNAWTYRWNPNPFVAAGYAVLMPDPAISTGYGQHMIDRGQHQLGGAPFTDILALTDATVARGDIDETRTAFSGGSYGGYMSNWVAGHTGDRFRCVVTHASLWDTESMGHTTDNAGWESSMRLQNATYNPKDSVKDIVVPMLVIHGDKDYRVPIAQGHALWYDLNTFSATPRDADGRTRHRYLYFPDEGHWILGRGNAQVWYETFIAFLDQHVRGVKTDRTPRLG